MLVETTVRPVILTGDRVLGRLSVVVRRRVVVDQIASLTDTSANAWHRRLCR